MISRIDTERRECRTFFCDFRKESKKGGRGGKNVYKSSKTMTEILFVRMAPGFDLVSLEPPLHHSKYLFFGLVELLFFRTIQRFTTREQMYDDYNSKGEHNAAEVLHLGRVNFHCFGGCTG